MTLPTQIEIDAFYQQMDNLDYYQLLQVNKNSTKLEITRAFRNLVSVWHIDRFAQTNYDDSTLQKVRVIFQRINDAYRVLSNPIEKSQYDAKIEGRPDVGTVLATENKFLRGKRALRDDKIELAKQMFDEVYQAVPDDPNYKFHKLYCDYLMLPKSKVGRAIDTQAAKKIYLEMMVLRKSYEEATDWMYEFIGMVALGMGDDKLARNSFRKAIKLNPNNVQVQRRLRLMERRRAGKNDSGSSLLDTIKGWFSRG